MRRWLALITIVLLAGLGALLASFLPTTLVLPAPEIGALPPASPPAAMAIAVIDSGAIESRAGLAFRGGAFAEQRRFAMAAVLVRHPRGDLLIDAGFGSAVADHVATAPKLAQWLTDYRLSQPVATQLRAHGYAFEALHGIVLTHAHWDHVSGIADLPGVPVWVNQAEYDFIHGDSHHTALLRSFGALPYRRYAFDDGEYLGFPNSYDVWNDGSVVIVPAPGHTPGSIIVFLALPDGRRYALLGDLVWQSEGITLPAERPWLARVLIGEDRAQVRDAIARIRAIQARHPEIALVPAHDARALAQLPAWP